MGKKTKDLKADTVLKNYWNDNEQFADLFNAVLFEGKQIIKPEELEDVDTEESSVLEHREYAETIKAARDNIKIQKKSTVFGVEFVLLGLESQERIHYAMPMRVMGYDYGSYKKQYDSNAKKYKTAEGMTDDEFLSRMKKTDKFIPVITIVIYYGENPWDGALSLHEMLNIPEEMKKYVNDYKMLLVEARKNNLQLHNINNVDLFNLLEIILDVSRSRKEAMKEAMEYGEGHKIDKSVIMTVAGATNSKIDYKDFEKGDGNMCTLFEEIARESEAKGLQKGLAEGITEGMAKQTIEMGREFGLTDEEIIERLQKKLQLTKEDAMNYLKEY